MEIECPSRECQVRISGFSPCAALPVCSGALCLPFHKPPNTNGWLKSPCAKATTTSSPTAGTADIPASGPPPRMTSRAQSLSASSDIQGNLTFIRHQPLGSSVFVTTPITSPDQRSFGCVCVSASVSEPIRDPDTQNCVRSPWAVYV